MDSSAFTSEGGWLIPRRIPFVIAEVGVNHNGSLDLALSAIDAAAAAGADAVKFQAFRADEEVADRTLTYSYTDGGKEVAENLHAMFKRLELPGDWHRQLKRRAESKGLVYFSSVADRDSARAMASIGVAPFKIGSCDVTYYPFLEFIGSLRVPVILSTGMADEGEIDLAIAALREAGCPAILLLHCVSLYPAGDETLNLRRMQALSQRYGCRVGFSDHSLGTTACIAATAMGAVALEKHFTPDRSLPGPDHGLSSDPAELAELASAVRRVARQLGTGAIRPAAAEDRSRVEFRRSIVAARAIPPGTRLTDTMLAYKRPASGLSPDRRDELVGRRTTRAIACDEQFSLDDLADDR